MASYIHRLGETPYGLRNGQIRGTERLVHNGLWFNRQWQKIGWGDLAEDDFVKIGKAIPFGDLFIVLDELVNTPVIFTITAEYCIDNCSWLVEHGWVYHVERLGVPDEPVIYRGIRFREIVPAAVGPIIERIRRINSR